MASAKHWHSEIDRYRRQFSRWSEEAERVAKRYRAEGAEGARGKGRLFNVLWSNIQVMKPALFSHVPTVIAERRHRDQDPIGRIAAEVIQRGAAAEIEDNGFVEALNRVVLDVLLVGRGTVWTRFEADHVPDVPLREDEESFFDAGGDLVAAEDVSWHDGVPMLMGGTTGESVKVDYVHWSDFAHSVERTWKDVERRGWVARRAMLTAGEVVSRFGPEFGDISMEEYTPGSPDDGHAAGDSPKRAEVWEIWDAASRKRIFVAKGEQRILEESPDPFGLDGFFPCPPPAYATLSNESLVPVPDYRQYESLAIELDSLSARINGILKALRLVGIYDASAENIGNLLTAHADGTMLPVKNMGALIGKHGGRGLDGVMSFIPLESILVALSGLYDARERAKQALYEISGVSDVIRGSVDHREKATQSRIKAEFAGQRLDERRRGVERMARDTVRIAVDLMAALYPPPVLREKAGFDFMPEIMDLDPGAREAMWVEVYALVAEDATRAMRIDIETDSTIELAAEATRESRNEFLTAMSEFMTAALPLVQADPAMGTLMGDFMLFTARGYRAGRPLEAAIETYVTSLEQRQAAQAAADAQADAAQQQAEAAATAVPPGPGYAAPV